MSVDLAAVILAIAATIIAAHQHRRGRRMQHVATLIMRDALDTYAQAERLADQRARAQEWTT